MVSLKWGHGCGLYCLVFFIILMIGIAFPANSEEYDLSIEVGAIWIMFFCPFIGIWWVLVKKTQSPTQFPPPYQAPLNMHYGGLQPNYQDPPAQVPYPPPTQTSSVQTSIPPSQLNPVQEANYVQRAPPLQTARPGFETETKQEKTCPVCGGSCTLGLKYCERCGHFF